MKVLLRRLAEWLPQRSPLTVTVIALCLVVALGVPDYFAPQAMTFTFLYMLVVVFVGWAAGRWPAVFVSGVVVIVISLVHWVLPRRPLPPEWVVVWNTLTRFLFFSTAGWLTAELTCLNRDLRKGVGERTAQWKAEAAEHKATAGRLAEAVERFEQVVHNIAEVFWLTDVSKNEMVYISPGYERIWGRTCEELYREPKTWLAAVHPADRDMVVRRVQTEVATGNYDVEYRIVRPDGAIRWIRDQAFPVRNAAGEVCRIAGIARDITERHQMHEAWRMQATILENMAEGVVVTDEQGVILQMNPAAERIWGYGSKELAGQPADVFSALTEPERSAKMQEVLAALRDTGTWRGIFNNRRKDGANILCEAVMNRLELPDRVLYVALEQDVTERKRGEATREAFLSLGAKLSTVRTPVEAARAIYATADQLWQWDAGALVLCAADSDQNTMVLGWDIIAGQRREITPAPPRPPTGRMRRIMAGPGELMQRKPGELPTDDFRPIGDTSRLAASLMYVPVRTEGQVIGVLSVHSYTPNAYTPEDLWMLQALADYCGGALTRLRSEQSTRQREALNRAILASAMDGYYMLDFAADPLGVFVEANPAFCRMTGYTREELLGMRMSELEAVESPEEVARHVVKLVAQGEDRFETRHRRKDGREIPLEISLSLLPGKPGGVFGFVRDITERKRAELMKEAFLSLGARLSAVTSPAEAARAVYAAADQLWQWDSATLNLYVPEADLIEPALYCDVVDGKRQEVALPLTKRAPTARLRRIMQAGAQLILRKQGDLPEPDAYRFGDVSRASASILAAPICQEGRPVGVLTIQSYTPNAYTPEDVRTLQALADYCGGALERIQAEAALRESEELVRAFYDSPGGLRGVVELVEDDILMVSANLPQAQAYGRTAEQMRSVRSSELGVPRETIDLWREKFRQSALANGPVTFEYSSEFRAPGGWGMATVCPLHLAGSARPRFAYLALDITDRKRAEAALREAHDRLEQRVRERTAELEAANAELRRTSAILQAINQGTDNLICLKDAQGKIIMANPAMARFLGKTESEIIGMDDLDSLSDPQQAARVRENDRRVMTTGRSETVEEAIDQPDRKWHCLFTKTPYRDAAGRTIGVIGVGLDITERKALEQALREAYDQLEQRVCERTAELQAANAALQESEERYRSLVNNLNVGVYRNRPSPHGGFIQVNPALARMHGYDSVEEFQKLTVADLYEDLRDRERFLAELRRHGTLRNYEVRLKQKDGTPIYASVNATAHLGLDGQLDWIDGVIEDITQRKEAEAALREHENRFRAVFESSSDCILVWDRQYNYLYANQAAIDHVGTTRDKVIGQNIRSGLGHIPEFMRLWMRRVDQAFATGESFRVHDAMPVQGRLVYSESQVSPIRDAAGRVIAVGVVYRDITERKQAEQQLAEALDLNQKMIAAAALGIAAYKASGECVFANEALAGMVGGTVSQVGTGNFRRLEAWQQCGLLRLADQVLSGGGQARSGEFCVTTRFGKTVWLDCHLARFVSNHEPHLLLMALDISERKRAEAALRRAERLQRAILDNIPDPVWLKDAQGRFLAGNQAFAELHGLSVEAVAGKTVFDVIPPEAARMTRDDKQAMKTRRPVVVEALIADAQGRRRWFESIKSPLLNERSEATGTVGIARDITERKRTATLLEVQRSVAEALSQTSELEAGLRHLLGTALKLGVVDTGAVYLLDEATGGMNIAVHHGGSPAFVNAVSRWVPDSAQVRLIRKGRPIFAAARDLPILQDKVRRSEGLRATALVPLCHGGRVVGALALGSHEADEIPRQTQLVMEAIAAQASGAIARIRAETQRQRLEHQVLEISDRQQARMGQEIHDGLCQHLVSLAFDANLLHRGLVGARRPEAKFARRIAHFLDQAITEARQLSRGLFPVRLQTAGLPPALEDLARATAARFKLRCRFTARGPVAVADSATATHLYRIAQEALTNAVKHSQARSVSIRLRANARQIELCVEDDGHGLTSARRKQATGLGLHIMDYRARVIGGTLQLRRGRRGGTLVSCCVPRRRR